MSQSLPARPLRPRSATPILPRMAHPSWRLHGDGGATAAQKRALSAQDFWKKLEI